MKATHVLIVLLLPLIFFSFQAANTQTAIRPRGTTYHTKEYVIQMFTTLCDAHKDVASYEVIGESYEGREIWLFKVGNPEGGKVMVDGSCHGTEDAGTELSYLFLKWVLESGEDEAKKVLRGNYLLIIPIINMDRYKRQNARIRYEAYESPTGEVINCPYGVDLNRNGVCDWGEAGSGDPYNNYEYRGAWAGSEPETQAYRNAMDKYRPDIYVNCHFGAEYMLNEDHPSKMGMRSKVMSLYEQLRSQHGITYAYPLRSYGFGGGFIANDASDEFGASGWIVEFALWDNVPADYNEFVSVWYPRAFPLYLAWCQAVQVDVPPTTPPVPDVVSQLIALVVIVAFALYVTKPKWNR